VQTRQVTSFISMRISDSVSLSRRVAKLASRSRIIIIESREWTRSRTEGADLQRRKSGAETRGWDVEGDFKSRDIDSHGYTSRKRISLPNRWRVLPVALDCAVGARISRRCLLLLLPHFRNLSLFPIEHAYRRAYAFQSHNASEWLDKARRQALLRRCRWAVAFQLDVQLLTRA